MSPRAPKLGELRPSQIITTFGPGAVVDLQSASVIIASIEHWHVSPRQSIDEPRLRSQLRTSHFYRPPVQSDGGSGGVPSYLFPQYLRCSRCKRLGRFDRDDLFRFDRSRFRCLGEHKGKVPKGGPIAFPARFVVACTNGHLDDFPWLYYVHRGKVPAKCRRELLTLKESAQSASISDIRVACEICPASRSMDGAFGDQALKSLGHCGGSMPWVGHGAKEECVSGKQRTVLRGASNLYFPLVHSALSLPDWDDPIHMILSRYEEQLTRIATEAQLEAAFLLGVFPDLEAEGAPKAFRALQKRRAQQRKRPTPMEIRREEYEALRNQPNPVNAARHEFHTEHVAVPSKYRQHIKRLVVVHRLREVRAISAFTRIDSPYDFIADEDTPRDVFGVQRLASTDVKWLPAVELRGEGVFIELDEEKLAVWEKSVSVERRSQQMSAIHRRWRAEHQLTETPYPGGRYVLLHTLSHLLINALALDCGYSSTSIRERIYSSQAGGDAMAGILLYTATPDSDGTLGGLCEKGKSHQFNALLRDALERATYCSSDPLCGHSAPGEMGYLNGAACHACLMASETSCERGNRYLDRAHVVSTVALLGTGYFG